MYYHFTILLLFRPLIRLEIIGSNVVPRDVCCQAADAIQGLLRSYSQLYTLQRTPTFMSYLALASSIMHLAIGETSIQTQIELGESLKATKQESLPGIDPHIIESIKQGVEDLKEMAPCHYSAEQAIKILQGIALKWDIGVDIGSWPTSAEEYARKT